MVALELALAMREELGSLGARAGLSRDRADVHLSNTDRAQLANESGAVLALRIHCDGVRPSLRALGRLKTGTLTLRPAARYVDAMVYEASRIAATRVHAAALRGTGLRDRGIAERADLAGFNYSTIPVVLSELGYLTHPLDERLLLDPRAQRRIARELAAGALDAIAAIQSA